MLKNNKISYSVKDHILLKILMKSKRKTWYVYLPMHFKFNVKS